MNFKSLCCGMLLLFLPLSAYSVEGGQKSRFEKLELFNKVLYLIESQYYRPVDTEKLIQGALKGMMSTLDPHSTYLGADVFRKMQEDTQGEFGGLGIEVTQKDGVIVVITPIDDTPAFRAGIKPGDRIVEIDNESTAGLTLEEAVDKMRGKPKSKISVGLVREGVDGVKRMSLSREIIKFNSVKAQNVKDGYVYLRLTQFQKDSSKSLVKHFKKIKKTLSKKKEKVNGIILDLRSNPGGLLEEAVNVSSLFMRDGIVVSTESRDPKQKEIKYVKKTGFKELDIPLAVLINGASASASEIVAGAIQDSGRGLIMGSQSFGKGSVQSVVKIDGKKGIKLTIAQYMTPKGRKIQAVGIKPDIGIGEYDDEFITEHQVGRRYLREKDLRNHLTATIETEDEKKERLKKEKEERIERRNARLNKSGKKAKKKKEFEKYDANKDYQVGQAIKYLKAYDLAKNMKPK